MKKAHIITAVRTPIGKAVKGTLRDTRPDELAAIVIREVIQRANGFDPERIDDVIMGCAMPEAEQGLNVARIALMRAELPHSVPGVTVNRFCASGLEAIHQATARIRLGFADAVIAGGVESMSMIPMGGNKVSLNPHLTSNYPQAYISMGNTAERVAAEYNVSREEQDAFALRSHQRAADAVENGRFRDEIVPVSVSSRHINEKNRIETTQLEFAADEGVRSDTSITALAGLKPAFKVDGTVTAGNSSGINDGAAALVLADAEFARAQGWEIMALVGPSATVGVDPACMGLGPIPATRKVLELSGQWGGGGGSRRAFATSIGDVDLIELNEAFAAQSIPCIRELKLDVEKVNVNGGAIALGHPLGCTGARLAVTLIHEMIRREAANGLATLCVGVGQGAATLFALPG